MVNKKFLWEVTTWDKRFSGIDKSMQPKVIKYHYYLAKELKEIEQEDGDIRILYTTEEEAYTNRENAGDNISSGEIVAIPWGGNASVKYFNGEFVTADNRIATSSNTDILLNKYLYYWMLSHLDELESYYRGAGIKHPSMYSVLTMEITIPDLKIQQDIITKLDDITSLISNLDKEIKLTKKQFEHYRNTLLSFNEKEGGVDHFAWKKISEIGTIYRGIAYSKKDFTETGTPCIHYGQIYTRYGTFADKTFTCVSDDFAKGKRLAKKGDLIMAVTSENLEDVGKCLAWLGEDDILVSNHACFIRHSLNPKYLAYILQTSYFFNYKRKISKGVKVIDLDLNMFGEMLIPIPSMEEQQRIVSKLDTFSNLISKLEEERDLHQKQYEYYREKLLTFE